MAQHMKPTTHAIPDTQSGRGGDFGVPVCPLASAVRLGLGHVEDLILCSPHRHHHRGGGSVRIRAPRDPHEHRHTHEKHQRSHPPHLGTPSFPAVVIAFVYPPLSSPGVSIIIFSFSKCHHCHHLVSSASSSPHPRHRLGVPLAVVAAITTPQTHPQTHA